MASSGGYSGIVGKLENHSLFAIFKTQDLDANTMAERKKIRFKTENKREKEKANNKALNR